MKLTFGGAAGEVTGSAYLVETAKARVLVDFGLFQGTATATEHNRKNDWVPAQKLDAIVVTHGHLDHVGRLPLLPRLGFKGPIYATPPSVEVAKLILLDAAFLQEADAARISKRRLRTGRAPVAPLYTQDDAEKVCKLFKGVPYGESRNIAPGLTIRFEDAGHILGSASVALTVEEGGGTKQLLFSGDVGLRGTPLLRDPTRFAEADFVVHEATYGDRDHRSRSETIQEFVEILLEAVEKKQKVFIPSFAIGRTQQMLYVLFELMRDRKVPRLPVFLDSPMAIKATELYQAFPELYDDEARLLHDREILEKDFRSVQATATREESMALNDQQGPCVIIAGAGMCNGGRILHHFKHNLWRPETRVIIVGYQGHGTLGSALVHGARWVRIHGDRIAVKAKVHTLGGFSAHAGRSELLEWFAPLAKSKPRLALTHGEPGPRKSLGEEIVRRWNIHPEYPRLGDTLNL